VNARILAQMLLRSLLSACVLLLGACGDGVPRREFNTRGVVRGISADGRTIAIQHESIPGYMPEATTIFNVKKRRDVGGLRPGHGISFRVLVTEKDASVDRINMISPEQVWVKPPTPAPTAQAAGAAGLAQPR
jgi:Cu/Ag efflux protein CusF